jgi:glycosyltransferase involved in cell wall biosynthesis
MISFLVPVYEFDVCEFVRNLKQQADAAAVPYEILCYDDASSDAMKQVNREISDLEHVNYTELPRNYGRAAIRNLLAEKAQYEQLLFMDCDSEIPDGDFVTRYLAHSGQHVTYGGRSYSNTPPAEADQYFRWFYGRQAEQTSAAQRRRQPYQSFMTNNFMIPRAMIESIKFDESLQGYGHEDTLFGYELKQAKIKIKHIDNPLIHIGLESSVEFLNKTDNGLENLVQILKERSEIGKDIKLVRAYRSLRATGLVILMRVLYRMMKESIPINLASKGPRLWFFQLYKLGRLDELLRN